MLVDGLNICFLGSARYSQPLEQTSEKKFRALQALGTLFVIGFSQSMRPQRFNEHAHFYLLPGLSLPVLRHLEMFVLGFFLALWLIFRHRVQVLIAQSPYEGSVAAITKRIARWLGRSTVLVVESHGDFEESLFLQRRIPLPKVYRPIMQCAADFSLKHADLLRAISNSTRQQLQQSLPEKWIYQFPTWTDIEVFFQADRNDVQFYSQHIVYAGVLIPRKGIHFLVNAFAQVAKDFPKSCLRIIGDEENKVYAAELRQQVRRLGLVDRVQFVEKMPQAELAAAIHHACVLVLPSVSEGLGRVVVEAMAAGRPVIGSNVGGIPEMVKDGVTGFLLQPGDELSLAQRLRWVLEHPGEVREMGYQAQAFAKHFFSTKAYVQGYRQILEETQTLLNK